MAMKPLIQTISIHYEQEMYEINVTPSGFILDFLQEYCNQRNTSVVRRKQIRIMYVRYQSSCQTYQQMVHPPTPVQLTGDRTYKTRKTLRNQNKAKTHLHKPETMQDNRNFSKSMAQACHFCSERLSVEINSSLRLKVTFCRFRTTYSQKSKFY